MKKSSTWIATLGWLATAALALLMALASPTCSFNRTGVPPLWGSLMGR